MSRPTPGRAPVRKQLVLPLRGRTGCRWWPLLILALLAAAGGAGASYWLGLWPAGTALVPAVGESRKPTPTVVQVTAATFEAEAAKATVSHTPAPSSTAMATSTRDAPATTTPSSTPTRQATATPTASPSATPTWASTSTPVPTPTVTAPATPAEATPLGTACDPTLVATIERAAEAQALYMEGRLDAAALAAAWGGAAADARTQAERMMSYRAGDIVGVQVSEVEWLVNSCRARAYDGWVQVTVSEEWRYTAQLTCASGAFETSVWSEAFASETYALVRDSDGWRIRSWRIEAPDTQTRWRCPASQ